MSKEAAAPRELSITRLIHASPETVYRVWTERTAEWWAPLPYTTPVVDWDLRAGGSARTVMKGPDGVEMDNEGVFLEVVPNRKIVFTDAFKAGWIPQDQFMVAIVTFEPEDGGTRYTARVLHWSEEALKRHEAMGFQQGWSTVAEQLARLAEAETSSKA